MRQKISIILICLVLLSNVIYAEENSSEKVIESQIKLPDNYIVNSNFQLTANNPQVAIALSGGGARALVNVGIIKALEEARVPIDLIVGSSMGSIIAVMYGSGMPIEQIERMITEVAIPEMFAVNLPVFTPLLSSAEFNTFLGDLIPKENLSKFPVPTAVLSYDLTRGAKYIFTSGQIRNIIQASYALPFSFTIPQRNGSYLMDAGLQETTPAKAANLLGAEFVISTIAPDKLPYSDYNTPLRSLTRMITLVKEKNSQQIVNQYSDVVIRTDVENYSFMDFQLADKFVELGYQAAQSKIPLIKRKLKQQKINHRFNRKEEAVNLDELLQDIKYDRRLTSKLSLRPKIYWGRDKSYFKPKLFKDRLMEPQYELQAQYNRFKGGMLANQRASKELETKLRITKLTSEVDLLIKNNWSLAKEKLQDILVDIKYYQPNYIWGGGGGLINDKPIGQLNNYYQSKDKDQRLAIKSENNLLIDLKDLEVEGYLLLEQLSWRLKESLLVTARLVLDNTDLVDSPTIYRGPKSRTNSLGQGSLELGYSYQFPYSLELFNVLQGRSVETYCFFDYQSTGHQQAVGLGSSFNLRLLGIKPLELGLDWAYGYQQQETRTEFTIEMSF